MNAEFLDDLVRHLLFADDRLCRACPQAGAAGLAEFFVYPEGGEVPAYPCLAPFVYYVGLIFIPEVFYCCKYRVGGCLPQSAKGCGYDVPAEVLQGLYIFNLSLCLLLCQ